MHLLTPQEMAGGGLLEAPSTRRVFIQGLGWVSTALLTGCVGGCEQLAEAIRNRPVRRRLRTGSPEVDADIDTYRQAVALMKSLQPNDPLNWAAQAAIHGIANVGFTYCEHGTDHFFDWHRAYLFYFEKICQKLTGKPKFGLPYWNWNQDPDIHPAFLDTSSTLFMARARNSMSGSNADLTGTLDPIFGDSNFYTFRQQLEGTPHNLTHTYIGGTFGGFGSASDPLFWMHHCMVDYCWYKWNIDLHHDNTNDPTWVSHPNSHFVDADGNAASATAGVTTLMPLLAYQYESSAIGSAAAAESLRTKSVYRAVEKRIKEGANIRFDVKQRIRLAERAETSIARPLAVESKLSPEALAQIIDSDAARERVFASVSYAQLPATSDFAVRVFVNLPNATAATSTEDPHYAGSFGFFGSEPPGAAHAAGAHWHEPQFLVDLTATIQRLRRGQELKAGSPFALELVPAPFGGKFEHEDTQLVLTAIDILITPVIVSSGPR